jgi:hypothetical protein
MNGAFRSEVLKIGKGIFNMRGIRKNIGLVKLTHLKLSGMTGMARMLNTQVFAPS